VLKNDVGSAYAAVTIAFAAGLASFDRAQGRLRYDLRSIPFDKLRTWLRVRPAALPAPFFHILRAGLSPPFLINYQHSTVR